MTAEEAVYQYFLEPTSISLKEFKGGAINTTYHLKVEENGSKKDYKFQKMNAIFDVSLMEDIEFVTEHLFSKNIKTLKIVRTLKEEMFVRDEASWWRMFEYLPGNIFCSAESLEQAKEAGRLVGILHTALLDCDYEFKFKLLHYHDADFDMEKLCTALSENKNTDKYKQLKNLAEEILLSYEKLPKMTSLPKHIIHDDLKFNNILFDETAQEALALIDIDTFTHGTIAVELGDALRDWCMKGGEDAPVAHFDKEIYDTALRSYFVNAKFLTKEEKESIPYGVKLLTLELAARFVTDAFNESYFKLDSSKYKNLFDQNKKKAENQFSFFKEFSEVF